MKKYIPNLITCARLLGTLCLLLTETMSTVFFILYCFTGITDILDGWLARKLNLTSKFGAKLDSAADLTFYGVMLIKLFPTMWQALHKGIWYAVLSVIILRLISYSIVALKHHQFASLHTKMNKLSGFAVFAIPFIMLSPKPNILCWCVCIITFIATVEEFMIHTGLTVPRRTGKKEI